MVAVLDTRTGKVYIHTKDVGGVIDVVEKAKERAKQQSSLESHGSASEQKQSKHEDK